jgi:predicted membrane GTPase involved in stress response
VIFDAIINEIPEPQVDVDDSKGAQLLVAALAADSYLGKYAIGKIFRGKLKKNEAVTIMKVNGETVRGKIDSLYTKVDSIRRANDSIKVIIDTTEVEIEHVYEKYIQTYDRIVIQSVDSDCIFFSNYLSEDSKRFIDTINFKSAEAH